MKKGAKVLYITQWISDPVIIKKKIGSDSNPKKHSETVPLLTGSVYTSPAVALFFAALNSASTWLHWNANEPF